MKRSILATVAVAALIAGATVSAEAGRNDVGLKASGNVDGQGGSVVRSETTGAGESAGDALKEDSENAANPDDNNRDEERRLRIVPKAKAGPSGPPPGIL